MIRYFLHGLRAHFRQGRTLLALTVLGVALGVAAVVCIQILNQSAIAAFRGSVQAVSGETDLSVFGPLPTFAEEAVTQVLGSPGVEGASPLLRLDVALDRSEEGTGPAGFEILGLDVLPLSGLPWQGPQPDLARVLGQRGWCALTPRLAQELGLEPGDSLRVSCGTRRAELWVGALVDFTKRGPAATHRRAVMDIAQLQSSLGQPGSIHQIDVRLAAGAKPAVVSARLAERLGPSYRFLTPGEQVRQAEELLAAFHLNLTALSMVSLFVGFFVVYTTFQASLLRRRRELGILRCLGASRRWTLVLVLGEVTVLGLGGTLLGLVLGAAGARFHLADVSDTLTNLYLLEEIGAAVVPPRVYLIAAAVGVGGALAGALLPALDVARRNPRQLLAAFPVHERIGSAAPQAFAGGALLLGAAAIWYLAGGHTFKPAGFILGLAVLVALPAMTPLVVQRSFRRVPLRRFGFGFGVRSLAARLQGSAFSTASLAVSVSILVGITFMVGSFRSTLGSWVESVIQADVYITTASYSRARSDAILDETLIESLRRHPAVRATDVLRRLEGSAAGRPVTFVGVAMDLPGGEGRFPLIGADPGPVYRDLASGESVLVSEPLARKAGLAVGDRLPLATPAGPRSLPIAGIYRDYGSESGAVAMDLATMGQVFGGGPCNSASLYLYPGRDSETVVEQLRAEHAALPLIVRSNATLRREVYRIFDQTFLVTRLLQAVSLAVAALGIATTLLILGRERRSEIALCRALGAGRRQVFAVFLGKGAGMGSLGVGLGLVGGLALALILIRIVNRAYFGWTIDVDWRALALGPELATIAVAIFLASLYPAWKASRTPATELSRDDL